MKESNQVDSSSTIQCSKSHGRTLTTLVAVLALGSSRAFQQSASPGARGASSLQLGGQIHRNVVASQSDQGRRQPSRRGSRSKPGHVTPMQESDGRLWRLYAQGGPGDSTDEPQRQAMDMNRRIQRLMDRSNTLTERIASSPNSQSFVWLEDQLRALTAHLQKRKNAVVLGSNNAAQINETLEWMEQELDSAAQQLDEFKSIVVASLSPQARDNEDELRKEMEEISQMSAQLDQFLKQSSSSSTSKKKQQQRIFSDETSKQEMLNAYERAQSSISRLDHIRRELAAVEDALDDMEEQGVALTATEEAEDNDLPREEVSFWAQSQRQKRDPLAPRAPQPQDNGHGLDRTTRDGSTPPTGDQAGNFFPTAWYDLTAWPEKKSDQKPDDTDEQTGQPMEVDSKNVREQTKDTKHEPIPTGENNSHGGTSDVSSQTQPKTVKKRATVGRKTSTPPEGGTIENTHEDKQGANPKAKTRDSTDTKAKVHDTKQKLNFPGGGMDWEKLFNTLTNLGSANLSPHPAMKEKAAKKSPSPQAKVSHDTENKTPPKKPLFDPSDLPPPRNVPVTNKKNKQQVPKNWGKIIAYEPVLNRPTQWAQVQDWVNQNDGGARENIPANWAMMLQFDPDRSDGNAEEVPLSVLQSSRRPKKWAQVLSYVAEEKHQSGAESSLPRQWALMKKHVELVSIPKTSGIPQKWAEMKHWTAATKTSAHEPTSVEVPKEKDLPGAYETIMRWASRQRIVPSANQVLYLLRGQKVAAASKEGGSRWGSLENEKASSLTASLLKASAKDLSQDIGPAMPVTVSDADKSPPSPYELRNEQIAVQLTFGKENADRHYDTVKATPMAQLAKAWANNLKPSKSVEKMTTVAEGGGVLPTASIDTKKSAFPATLLSGRPGAPSPNDLFNKRIMRVSAMADVGKSRWGEMENLKAQQMANRLTSSSDPTPNDLFEKRIRKTNDQTVNRDVEPPASPDEGKSLLGGLFDLFQDRTQKVASRADAGKSRWGGMENLKAQQTTDMSPTHDGTDDNLGIEPAASDQVPMPGASSFSQTDLFNKRTIKVSAMAEAGKFSRWGEMENIRAQQMTDQLRNSHNVPATKHSETLDSLTPEWLNSNPIGEDPAAPIDEEPESTPSHPSQERFQKIGSMADHNESPRGVRENHRAQKMTNAFVTKNPTTAVFESDATISRGSPGFFEENNRNAQPQSPPKNLSNHRINWAELSVEAEPPSAAPEERPRKAASMENRKPANAFDHSEGWHPFKFGEAPMPSTRQEVKAEWPRAHRQPETNPEVQLDNSQDSVDVSGEVKPEWPRVSERHSHDSVEREVKAEWPRISELHSEDPSKSVGREVKAKAEWPRVAESDPEDPSKSVGREVKAKAEWPLVAELQLEDSSTSVEAFDEVKAEWPRAYDSSASVENLNDVKAEWPRVSELKVDDSIGSVGLSEGTGQDDVHLHKPRWKPFDLSEAEQVSDSAVGPVQQGASDPEMEFGDQQQASSDWPQLPVEALEEQGVALAGAEAIQDTWTRGVPVNEMEVEEVVMPGGEASEVDGLGSQQHDVPKSQEPAPQSLPDPTCTDFEAEFAPPDDLDLNVDLDADEVKSSSKKEEQAVTTSSAHSESHLKGVKLFQARTQKIAGTHEKQEATSPTAGIPTDHLDPGIVAYTPQSGALYLDRSANVAESAKAGKSRWGSLENWKAQVMVDSLESRLDHQSKQIDGLGDSMSMEEVASEWVSMNKEQPAPVPERTTDPSTALYQNRAFKVVSAAEAGKSRWGSMEIWKAQLIVDSATATDLECLERSSASTSEEKDVNAEDQISLNVQPAQGEREAVEPANLYEDRAKKISSAASAGKSRWGAMENSKAQLMVEAHSLLGTGKDPTVAAEAPPSSMAQLAAEWASMNQSKETKTTPLDFVDTTFASENEEEPADETAQEKSSNPSLIEGFVDLFQGRNQKVATMADAGRSRWGSMENSKARQMVGSADSSIDISESISSTSTDIHGKGAKPLDEEVSTGETTGFVGQDNSDVVDNKTSKPDESAAPIFSWKPKRRSWTGSMNEWAKAWSDMRSFQASASVDHLSNDATTDPAQEPSAPTQNPIPAPEPPLFSMNELAKQWASINAEDSQDQKVQNSPPFPDGLVSKPIVADEEGIQEDKIDAVVQPAEPLSNMSDEESSSDLVPEEIPNSYQTVMAWAAAETVPPTVANVIFQLRNFNVANFATNGKSRWGRAENLRSISMVKLMIDAVSDPAAQEHSGDAIAEPEPTPNSNGAEVSPQSQLIEESSLNETPNPGTTESMDALTASWAEDWADMNRDESMSSESAAAATAVFIDKTIDSSTASMDELTESWAEDWAALNKGDGTAEPDSSANILAPTDFSDPEAAVSAMETLGLAQDNDSTTNTGKQVPSPSDWFKIMKDWSRINSDQD